MMMNALMFLAFFALIGLAVNAVVIAIWLGIENCRKNKRIEYPSKKGGSK